MAKITFLDRDNTLREFEITEDLITIGREATNKLVIADPSVSRGHATVERREDGFYLIDKNSSNGTYVNGKRITQQQKLNHKDKVNFGSASVVFEDEEQEGATFIIPRADLPEPIRPSSSSMADRPTDALVAEEVSPADEVPLPPPPPLVSPKPAPAPSPPPPVAAAPPPPPPPPQQPSRTEPEIATPPPPMSKKEPETPVGVLCPSCRKVVEAGARFCGFCGAPLAPRPAAVPAPPSQAAPPKPPAPAPAPSAKMSMPPPMPEPPKPQPAPAAPRPAAVPPPPAGEMIAARPAGELNYAGFVPRAIAYLIDMILISVVAGIPAAAAVFVTMGMTTPTGEPSGLAVVIWLVIMLIDFVVIFGYLLYFSGAKGATIGMKMMKLRLTFPDGQYPIGYGKALVRLLVQSFLSGICAIGYIMILLDKEQHRALHDRIAGTVVLKEE